METEGSLPHLQYPPPVPILSQINPVLAPPFHFLKIQVLVIIPVSSTSNCIIKKNEIMEMLSRVESSVIWYATVCPNPMDPHKPMDCM